MPTTKKPSRRRPRSSIVVQRAAGRSAGAAPTTAQLRKYALAAIVPGSAGTLRVVGIAESRSLNGSFRKRHYATNVLSFSYDRRHGDVVLCHPAIRRAARGQ